MWYASLNLAGGLDLSDLQSAKGGMRQSCLRKDEAGEPNDCSGGGEQRPRLPRLRIVSCHLGVVTSPLLKNLGFGSGFDTAEKRGAAAAP